MFGGAETVGPGAVSGHTAGGPPAPSRPQTGQSTHCEPGRSCCDTTCLQKLHIKDYYGERVRRGQWFDDFDLLNDNQILFWSSEEDEDEEDVLQLEEETGAVINRLLEELLEAVDARLEEPSKKEEMDETDIRLEVERREGEMGSGRDI